MSLMELNRWDSVKALAEDRLSNIPNDPIAIRILANCAEQAGDFETATQWYKKLLNGGFAGPRDYNNLAWLGLFQTKGLEDSTEHAERAVLMTKGTIGAYLHTLSALLAEEGKTAEALEIIQKAIDLKPQKVPDQTDWYVLGRIAEQYGEKETAKEYYKKVGVPSSQTIRSISTYTLARKRIENINKQYN